MSAICGAEPCPLLLSSSCVFYEGESLIYIGVNTNDSLQTALQKINQAFTNAQMGYIFNNGLIQSGLSQPVQLGGSLIKNTTILGNYTLTLQGNVQAAKHITTGGTSSQFVKGDGTLDSSSFQPPGNYITGLSGDGVATGPGIAPFTLNTVNSNPGTFGASQSIPVVTVNAKGLVTSLTTTPLVMYPQAITFIGDVLGSGFTESTITLTLQNVNSNPYSGVTPLKFAVNSKGLVTAASPITSSDIISILGYTPGTVSSIGISVPPAFSVSNSPITNSGVIAISAIGTASQYIKGDGSLGTAPISTSGTAGTSGTSGSSGTTGTSGSSGTSGTTGTSGTSGTGGTSGTTGSSGSSGTSGSTGTSGSSGTTGTSGSSGTTGTSGSSGTSGTTGTSGSSGTSGTTGTSGSSGLSGDKYATSSTTPYTLQAPGGTGTITVATGLSFTLGQSIIITYSLDAFKHNEAIVTAYDPLTGILSFQVTGITGSGTYSSWEVNLDGATGGDGSHGTSGTSGTSASSGTSGTTGTSGSSGTSGTTGTSGSSGTSGTSATDGTGGTSGTSGSSGTSGTTGTSGTSATSGTSGTTGSSGTSGTSGSTGTSGTSGTSGANGSNGTSGTSGTTPVNQVTGTGTAGQVSFWTGTSSISGDSDFTYNSSTNALSVGGDLTANRYRGVNSLVLNTYTTVNPSSNVYLYSQPNDRDAWIFLDSADTGSNWGIYHRQIDSAVAGLPGNSIGFIGGGSSTLQGWISLLNGQATFNNNIAATSTGVDGTFADAFIGRYSANNNETNAIQTAVSSLASGSGFRFQASNGAGSSSRTTVVDFLRDRQIFYSNVGINNTNPQSRLSVSGDATNNEGLVNINNTKSGGGVYFPALKVRNGEGNHSYGIVSEFSTGSTGGDRPSVLFYSNVSNHSWTIGQVTSGWGIADSFGIGYRASNSPGTFTGWPSNYFAITTSGNALINTTSDNGSRLRVNGLTWVDGQIFSVQSNGTVRTSNADAAGMLHIRPNAGQSGYINFTENAVDDRWSIGITAGDSNFYFRRPYPTSPAVASISASGAATFSSSVTAGGFFASGSNNFVRFTSTGTADWGTVIVGSAGGARTTLLVGQSGYSNGFTVEYTGSAMQYIFRDGNVGIGTNNPTYRLQIGNSGSLADSIRIGDYLVSPNTRQYIGYARWDSGLFESPGSGDTPSTVLAGVAGIRIVNTAGIIAPSQADNSVQLLTHIYNGNSRVALHANFDGNIGISTTTPSSRLSLGVGIGPKFMIYDNASNVYAGMGQDLAAGNSTDIFAHGAGGGFITFGNLGTNKTTYTEWMRINSSGNVLIGTTTSTGAKLEVNGSIRTGTLDTGYVSGFWKLGRAVIGTQPSETHQIIVEINGALFVIGAAAL